MGPAFEIPSPGGVDGWPPGPFKSLGPGSLRAPLGPCGPPWAIVGPLGPGGPLWAPWALVGLALVGRALVGLALVGLALVGPPCALVGPCKGDRRMEETKSR